MNETTAYVVQAQSDATGEWEDVRNGEHSTLPNAREFVALNHDRLLAHAGQVRIVKRVESVMDTFRGEVRCRTHQAFAADNCPGCGTATRLHLV